MKHKSNWKDSLPFSPKIRSGKIILPGESNPVPKRTGSEVIKRKVMTRDGGQCFMRSKECNELESYPHHVDFGAKGTPEKNEPHRLVTICKHHHNEAHARKLDEKIEAYLKPYQPKK